MSTAVRIVLLGFSAFERRSIASYFRLTARRAPSYELVTEIEGADFLVADADDAATVQLVAVLERWSDTVFIGTQATSGGAVSQAGWLQRPIDPLRLVRLLDRGLAARRSLVPQVAALAALAQPVGSAGAGSTDSVAESAAPPTTLSLRALVVDDSEMACQLLRGRLLEWGMAVQVAAGSGAAVARLKGMAQTPVDMIFVDADLGPRSALDGLGLCQYLRRQAPPAFGARLVARPTLLVLVSAQHNELDRVRATLAGCDALLAKPLDDAALTELLLRNGLRPGARRRAQAA